MRRKGNNNNFTKQILKDIAHNPNMQLEIHQLFKSHVVKNVEECYLPNFKDTVQKHGKQLGRLPRYPNLSIDQLLALKPEGITDALLLPPTSTDITTPALYGQLDPQRPRRPGEVYLIPRPLLTSKLDSLFSSLLAAYNKLVDDLSSSAQSALKILGGTYESLEKRAVTLAQDNAKYDICHSTIVKINAEFANEFLGYTLYPEKYGMYRTKIEEFGRKIDILNPKANESERQTLSSVQSTLERLFCLTYLQPVTDSSGCIRFTEGYFENDDLKHREATLARVLTQMIQVQNLGQDLKQIQVQLKLMDENIHERSRMAELAKQAKEKPPLLPPLRKQSNEDEPAPKLVVKRWQLPSTTELVSSCGASSHSSKDSDSKYYVFKGINLGPDPIEIENAEGFNAYFYLDTNALDNQNFNYEAFENLSRIRFSPEEGHSGIKKISIPLKLRWSFNKVEQEPLTASYELKVMGTADRILLAEIPGDNREVLYVGLVGLPGGLHNSAQSERIVSMLKNHIFEITSPYSAASPSLQSLKIC